MGFIRLDFVLVRSMATLVVVLAITLNGWWPAGSVSSAAEMPIGATLKVVAAPVEVELAQTQTFVAGMDGQMLNQGDVVRTGTGGIALLTFFDGSESQLGAESTVQIERAEATPAPQIALLQTAGVTMNHVVPMPPGGSFQTDTPAATGLVRGTSYVVVVGDSAAATSVILLTDRDGHVGRVDVSAGGPAASAPIRLTRAGDAAASDGAQTYGAHVAAARLRALETAANARAEADAARDAERHAHVVAAALAGLGTKSGGNMDGQDALEPAAPVTVPGAQSEETSWFEEPGGVGGATPSNPAEQHQVAATSVPVAGVGGASMKTGDSQQQQQSGQSGQSAQSAQSGQPAQSAQSGQSGQSEQSGQSGTSVKPAAVVPAPATPPAAPVSRTVSTPPAVSVPTASGDKSVKPDKPNTP